jgi:hypothetical protein
MGGVGALSGALIADMFGRKRIRLIAVLSAAVLATLAFWHPAALLLNGHELAAQLRQKAPEVSKFGLEHFRQIDTNGDGIITSDEMAQAQKHLQLSNDDRALLSIMQSRVDEIGHAISTERTPVYTSVPFGNGVNMPVYSGDTVSHTYGIDKDDLEHYPQRVAFQWEKW